MHKVSSGEVVGAAAAGSLVGGLLAWWLLKSGSKKQQEEQQPKLKLVYFNFKGKAEAIRLACAHAGIEFENKTFASRDEFTAMKASGELPYGQVPALIVTTGDSTKVLGQSSAIIRYIASLSHGSLYPTDPVLAAEVDSLMAQEDDAFAALTCVRYQERFGFEVMGGAGSELTLQAETALAERVLPRHLGFFERKLTESKTGWLAGTDGPSIADFTLVPRLMWLRSGEACSKMGHTDFEAYPKINALIAKLMALPAVVEWYAARK